LVIGFPRELHRGVAWPRGWQSRGSFAIQRTTMSASMQVAEGRERREQLGERVEALGRHL
jgi:hypothetical protein